MGIISLLIVGLVVGGLGRLVVPGHHRMGLMATLGVGLIGAILGGIVGGIFGLGFFSLVPEIAIAAGLVWSSSSRSGRTRSITSRSRW
jgi:uncharacterized membrane protein YeaQ/YmgE (transglycosylase-associated protein family)